MMFLFIPATLGYLKLLKFYKSFLYVNIFGKFDLVIFYHYQNST